MKFTVEDAKSRISIVEIMGSLDVKKKSGNIAWCCCPFHSENTASCKIDIESEKYHCFGCNKSGDKLDLYMQVNGIKEVKDAICEIIGDDNTDSCRPSEQELEGKRLLKVCHDASVIYHENLKDRLEGDSPVAEYLRSRGVTIEMVEKYRIGYTLDDWGFISSRLDNAFCEKLGLTSPRRKGSGHFDCFRNRVMFPITDYSGRVCGFCGRAIGKDDKPKYMNSKDSSIFNKSDLLFGLYQNKDKIRESRRVILVEGSFDLISLDANGIGNVAASLGTALTNSHIKRIKSICKDVVVLLDGDEAGVKSAKKAASLLVAEGMAGSVAVIPNGDDPDSFIRKFGVEQLRAVIDKAVDISEYLFSTLISEHGTTLAGKNAIVEEIRVIIGSASSQANKDLIANHFAEKLNVKVSSIFPLGGHEERITVNPRDSQEKEGISLSAEEQKLVLFLSNNRHIAEQVLSSYNWSSEEAKELAMRDLSIGTVSSVSHVVDIEEVQSAIDGGSNLTTDIPDEIINPGGLISLGVKGLSSDGLPKYRQLILADILSVIGQALCGKISVGKKIPAMFNLKVAPSQVGKSEISDAMIYALRRAGGGDIIGPSKLQSGQSITRALAKKNNILCFCDEGARMLSGDKKGNDSNAKTMIETLLTLFSKNGTSYDSAYSDSSKNVELEWFAFGLCANATTDILDEISVSSLSNGMATRINFFCYDGPILSRGIGEGSKVNEDLSRFASKISAIISMNQHSEGDRIRGGAYSLSTAVVKEMLRSISDEVVRRCNENMHDNIRNSIIGQTYDMTLRIAMCHMASSRELWDLYDPIEEADITYGYRLARILSDWKLNVLMRRVSGSEFEEWCNIFYDGLVSCHARYLLGKGARPSISTIADRKKKAKWPVKVWHEIVSYLEATEKINVEKRGDKMFFSPIM